MNTAETVRTIIAEHLGIKLDKVTGPSRIVHELGGDSLDTVEIVMGIEERFNIEISDNDAEHIQCVDDLIKFVDKQLKS